MSKIDMIVSTHWEDYYTDVDALTEYVKGVAKRTPKSYKDLMIQFEKDTQKRIEAFMNMLESTSEVIDQVYAETEMCKADGVYYGWTIYPSLYDAVSELINVDEYENMKAYYEDDVFTLAFTHYDNEEPMVDYFTLKERTYNNGKEIDANIYVNKTTEVSHA